MLPWGWQTGDRPGGCNRGRNRLRLRLRFRTRSETDFDANDSALGFWNGFWNRKRLRLRYRTRLRLRLGLRFRRGRACRRRSRHNPAYVQTNSEFYFEKHIARSKRETPNPKLQIPRPTPGSLRLSRLPAARRAGLTCRARTGKGQAEACPFVSLSSATGPGLVFRSGSRVRSPACTCTRRRRHERRGRWCRPTRTGGGRHQPHPQPVSLFPGR